MTDILPRNVEANQSASLPVHFMSGSERGVPAGCVFMAYLHDHPSALVSLPVNSGGIVWPDVEDSTMVCGAFVAVFI